LKREKGWTFGVKTGRGGITYGFPPVSFLASPADVNEDLIGMCENVCELIRELEMCAKFIFGGTQLSAREGVCKVIFGRDISE